MVIEDDLASGMRCYSDYTDLKREFSQELGCCNRREIPDYLVGKIAQFCDAHADDMMAAYYATSLLHQFFRKRSGERWRKLFLAMDGHLKRKRLLIDIFFGYRFADETSACVGGFDASALWGAIDDLEDGYRKANLFKRYASLFTEDIALLAYQRAQAMPAPFRIRALSGIYPRMDELARKEIFSYLCGQFAEGSTEAGFQLKSLFPHLDAQSQDGLVDLYLSLPSSWESFVAYFVIRNAICFDIKNAQRMVARVGEFQSKYLKNRCLLKLNAYLPPGEIRALYDRFMVSFVTAPPSVERLHNFYQFSAVVKDLDKDSVIDMALEKIASFDDSKNEIYVQHKYNELSFIAPHLTEKHKAKAFAIAETVRGGYKKNLISRLRRHFSKSSNYCLIRYSPIDQ